MKKVIINVFCVVFSILFLIVTINTIFSNKTIQVDFSSIIIVISVVSSFLLVYFLYNISKKYNKSIHIKTHYKIIIAIVILLIQLVVAGLVYAHCGWDCGGVVDNAFSLYQGNGIDSTYYSRYPNNIAIVILLKCVYVVVGLFIQITARNFWWIAVMFNIIILDIGIIFTLLVGNKILGKKGNLLLFLIMIPLLIFSPHIIVPYTDTLTLCIPIAFFYFYLKIKENTKMKYLYLILEGILIVGGYLLKPTCIIIIIAIILAEIIYANLKSDKIGQGIKNIFVSILIFMIGASITYITYSYLKNKNISQYISDEDFERNSVSVTHFLMMGMQENKTDEGNGKNRTMYGKYNSQDVNSTLKIKGKDNKTKYNLSVVKQRLQDFGFIGYTKYIYNKANWILSDGTFYYGAEGSFFTTKPYNKSKTGEFLQGFFNIDTNEYQDVTAYTLQIPWVIILIGIIFTKENKEKEVSILKISIVGIVAFVLLFEGRSRYLFNYIPMFLIIGTLGIKNIIKYVDKKLIKLKT